jgi:hypothetical protein
MDDTPFPLDSHEHHGRWVGVSEIIGNFDIQNSYWWHQKDYSLLQHPFCLWPMHLDGTYGWTPLMLNPLRLSSPSTVLPLSTSRGGFHSFSKWWCQWFDWQQLPLYVHHLCKWFSRSDVPYGPKGRWAVPAWLYCGIY